MPCMPHIVDVTYVKDKSEKNQRFYFSNLYFISLINKIMPNSNKE